MAALGELACHPKAITYTCTPRSWTKEGSKEPRIRLHKSGFQSLFIIYLVFIFIYWTLQLIGLMTIHKLLQSFVMGLDDKRSTFSFTGNIFHNL